MEEIQLHNVSFQYPETQSLVIENLSLGLLKGITTFVGQNGTGKSTFLLLAAGILLPDTGAVYLQGIDTALLRDEKERQRYVSFIYQNMEFETEKNIGDLLYFVHEDGFRKDNPEDLLPTLINEFELEPILSKKSQEVSKGELQRTILAFSLLYGSRIVIMDEPIFALEDEQKYRAMHFLCEFAQQEDLSIYYSVHELDISQKFSDYTLLFQQQNPPIYGATQNVLTRERLEKAFEVPMSFLKQKETLYRDTLKGELNDYRLN